MTCYCSPITIQRTINESGTSAYLVKDEEMKDVVRKSKDAKEECLRILQKFQIQVDSPIVILQQDEAKEMLKVESADKLYKFFEKATLIRQCFDQYSAAQVGVTIVIASSNSDTIQSAFVQGGVQQSL